MYGVFTNFAVKVNGGSQLFKLLLRKLDKPVCVLTVLLAVPSRGCKHGLKLICLFCVQCIHHALRIAGSNRNINVAVRRRAVCLSMNQLNTLCSADNDEHVIPSRHELARRD